VRLQGYTAERQIKMTKQFIATILILGVIGMVVGAVVRAATGTVSCTVTPKLISVTVTDGEVHYGTVEVDSEKSSKDVGENQTVTNNGSVNEKIEVKTSNASGGTAWTAAGTAGNNQFVHYWSANPDAGSPTWTAWTAADVYATLVASLAKDGTQALGLKIHTPTVTTDYVEKSITVTVLATEAL